MVLAKRKRRARTSVLLFLALAMAALSGALYLPGPTAAMQLAVAITITGASPYDAPATVTVTATAPGATKVEFFAGNKLLGQDLKAPFKVTWSNLDVGNYSIVARATDNRGQTYRSNTINFSVIAKPMVSLFLPEETTPDFRLAIRYC
jgi:hypothetical protein